MILNLRADILSLTTLTNRKDNTMKDKAEELRQILNTIENFIIANEGIGSVSLKMLWDRLSDAITNLDQQSKWISVEERLPEFVWKTKISNGSIEGSAWVLVWFGESFPAISRLRKTTRGKEYWEEMNRADITHWMPLPDPPA